jgi:phytoene dehydrogenase-like protein
VRVLEARDCIGGAAVTEEFHPGFRNSVYSYSVSLLHPKVITDLRLEEHGLEIMERPAGSLSLLPDGHMQLTRDGAQARREIARFSKRDAERIDAFEDEIGAVARPCAAWPRRRRRTSAAAGGTSSRSCRAATSCASSIRKHQIVLTELMTRSLGDHLDAWFEGDRSRACSASRG